MIHLYFRCLNAKLILIIKLKYYTLLFTIKEQLLSLKVSTLHLPSRRLNSNSNNLNNFEVFVDSVKFIDPSFC
jgi:hypothetical protein